MIIKHGTLSKDNVVENIRYYLTSEDNEIKSDLLGSDILIVFKDGEFIFEYSDFQDITGNLYYYLEKHGFSDLLIFAIKGTSINIEYRYEDETVFENIYDFYYMYLKPKFNISPKPFADFVNNYYKTKILEVDSDMCLVYV